MASRFAQRRKEHFLQQQKANAKPDPVEDLTVRTGQRICAIVYGRPCDCEQRGLRQLCDIMRSAAQAAFSEVIAEK